MSFNRKTECVSFLKLIPKSLPGLRQDVQNQLQKMADLLAAVPAKLTQVPSVALLKLITTYTAELDSLAQGGPKHRHVIHDCNSAFKRFRQDIRGTAPVFIPKTREEIRKNKSTQAAEISDDSDAEIDHSVYDDFLDIPQSLIRDVRVARHRQALLSVLLRRSTSTTSRKQYQRECPLIIMEIALSGLLMSRQSPHPRASVQRTIQRESREHQRLLRAVGEIINQMRGHCDQELSDRSVEDHTRGLRKSFLPQTGPCC